MLAQLLTFKENSPVKGEIEPQRAGAEQPCPGSWLELWPLARRDLHGDDSVVPGGFLCLGESLSPALNISLSVFLHFSDVQKLPGIIWAVSELPCLPGHEERRAFRVCPGSISSNKFESVRHFSSRLLFAKHYFWQASVTKPNALCILFPPRFIVLAHVVFVGNFGKFITKVLSY